MTIYAGLGLVLDELIVRCALTAGEYIHPGSSAVN